MSGLSFAPIGRVCAEGRPLALGLANGAAPLEAVAYSAPGAAELRASTPAVAVIGAFDGLHLGHQALVRDAIRRARDLGIVCVALTFDPDPSELLGPAAPGGRLLSVEDRCQGLLALGADHVIALSFTKELAGMAASAFVEQVLCGLMTPTCVLVGADFRFGRGGAGSARTLAELGGLRGFEVVAHPLVEDGGQVVCATRVRDLLRTSELAEANRLLGRCHYVRGSVAHGRGEGTSFGFPTANVTCDAGTCMPAEGVYACYLVCDGLAWPAAANVGAPPTFSSPRPAFLEANLIGFEGDLYGRAVSVSFVRWLRASRKFSSMDELMRVVLGNIAWVRDNLGEGAVKVAP